jgi:hypothetical protein
MDIGYFIPLDHAQTINLIKLRDINAVQSGAKLVIF